LSLAGHVPACYPAAILQRVSLQSSVTGEPALNSANGFQLQIQRRHGGMTEYAERSSNRNAPSHSVTGLKPENSLF
jgi:hypothetical protein